MMRLSNEGLLYPWVGKFGPVIVSVLPYGGGEIKFDKPSKVADMTAKERREAAKFVHKAAVKFGIDGGKSADDYHALLFGPG